MKNNKIVRFGIFLFFNFLALAVGVLLMNNGPRAEWYMTLNKAPWTPPGWVFGVAWSSIMFLFSFYMTNLSFKLKFLDKNLVLIYSIQWILNVGWNLVFFNRHSILGGLFVIVLLWFWIGYITFKYRKFSSLYTLLILPYLFWMTIAMSLNAYIYFNN